MEETIEWMKQSVEINQNAIAINLSKDTDHNPSLIEYLVYKYSKMKYLKMESSYFRDQNKEDERISRAISNISSYNLKDQNNFQYIFPCLDILKGDKNVFQLMFVGESHKHLYEDGSILESRVNQDQQPITKSRIHL
ncbi:bud site selection protein [Mucor velutinosus]|uniref:Bud site selection protein n=1 Tax=Mucor velutinosus TaxID=708070 RepID=A0AAN7DFR9_9FUNG|nr:bud site selection protein [Mucor velutinosus]